MATFSVNSSRRDPYKNFKFRVKWDGRYVAGVTKVSGFKRRSGAVTLERGITHDKEFEAWATGVWVKGSEASQQKSRRDIIVDVYNEAGKKSLSYKLHQCRVSEIQALPDLDANANAVAIESMKLESEWWERIDLPT